MDPNPSPEPVPRPHWGPLTPTEHDFRPHPHSGRLFMVLLIIMMTIGLLVGVFR
jgi:hypothetical protein